MKIKWCISDIDGTLMNSQRQMPREVIDAVSEYVKRGGIFALATGRSVLSVQEVVAKLEISPYLILCNGGSIYDPSGNILLNKKVDGETSFRVAEYALKMKFDFLAYTEQHLWHPHDSVRVQYFKEKTTIPTIGFSKPDELPHGDILKFFLWNVNEKIVRDFELNCNATKTLNCVQSVNGTIDIDPAGATKGGGVKFLSKHLGLSTDDAAAFGDNLNDVDMLTSVGYPFAVQNAEEELKRVAKRICPSNDDCGVAVMLREFMDD